MTEAIPNLIKLALPIIIGQLGQMLIGAGDVYVASLYSTESVASIGVASGVFNPIFLFGIGLMMGVSPSLAYLRGKNQDQSQALLSIIIYASLCGICLTLSMLFLNQFVPYLGFSEIMVPSIQKYISIVAWSIPFAIIFQAIKEYLQAYEEVIFPNILTLIAVILNLATNYMLVFGFASFEGLGEVGLALASLVIRIFLCLSIFFYVLKTKPFKNISFSLIKVIFKFSLPIAFMFFLEVLAFCTVTILSGRIGIVPAAANNIIMTIASIVFMVPLSLSSAVSVKVGHAYGAQKIHQIKQFIFSALIINFLFILLSSGSLFLFPAAIMHFITQDLQVIELGISLLFIVAIFQVSDSTQVIFTGILRGLKHTQSPSAIIFVGYWIIGIPYGYYLAFFENKGAQGLWIGLAVSLSFCAVFLVGWTYYLFNKLSKQI